MTDDRPRSFWGWGYSDRFRGRGAREALAKRLERELGFPERPILDPPTMEAVSVADPRLDPPSALDDVVVADREARIRHAYGRSYRDLVRGFHGEYATAPDLVATPEEEADVRALLSWAAEARVAVVPYGGGTSVVGGIECRGEGYAGVLSVDMRGLDRVTEVDRQARTACIEAGATGPAIQEQLESYDLQLRHYPQSYEFSTLGGWLATRAGGHYATGYTRIDDFVENVRMITPTGPVETGQVPSTGAGPDPNRLLLGSEGAFGVITRAWMRVQPRPRYRATASVRFDDWQRAVDATRSIVQAGLTPANCRLLDRNEAMIAELSTDGSHALLLGFESVGRPVGSDLQTALDVCRDHAGRVHQESTEDGDEIRGGADTDAYRNAFFEAPYRFNELVSVGVLVDTFETATTWDRFPDLHDAVYDRVHAALVDACGMGFISCRLTHVYPDGPAPYYTMLAPAEVGEELEQWRAVKAAASEAIRDHDATITHHHAVGRIHRPWYDREFSDRYREALGAMKRTLDPEAIMNPGVLID